MSYFYTTFSESSESFFRGGVTSLHPSKDRANYHLSGVWGSAPLAFPYNCR